jgi:hypothetical protein
MVRPSACRTIFDFRTVLHIAPARLRISRRGGVCLRVEQPVQMNDEVTHQGVVDRLLRFSLPRRLGARVIREDADKLDFIEIAKLVRAHLGEFATDDEVQKLFRIF